MIGLHSRIYDTSAMLCISNREEGFGKIMSLLHESPAAGARGKASALSAFEFLFSTGRKNAGVSVTSLAFFESVLDFLPADSETAKRAAFLRLKYRQLNLSLADSIIIQTGIDNDYEIVTCDKAWSKVSEAKVRVV